jgi:hypothetical protein
MVLALLSLGWTVGSAAAQKANDFAPYIVKRTSRFGAKSGATVLYLPPDTTAQNEIKVRDNELRRF